MRASLGALLLVGLVALPDAGEAFTANNGARVNVVNADVFEVVPRRSAPPSYYWCAAAQYANRIGIGWAAPLYVVAVGQSVTTNRRSAAQFTANPNAVPGGPKPESPTIRLTTLRVGESRSVQLAFNDCGQLSIRH
jgi:hypothetical protein